MTQTTDKISIWDPLRRKEVALTPEERVRQWFIGVLRDSAGVPVHMMMSEVAMEYGQSRKKYRADIVVYGKGGRPAMIVECKRPEVELSKEVLEQALRYSMVLPADYYIMTNGSKTYVAHKENGEVRLLDKLPIYKEICQQ